MHFIAGLIFLVLIVLLLFAYFLSGYAAVYLLRYLYWKRCISNAWRYDQPRKCEIQPKCHPRLLYWVFIFLLVFNALFYIRQRSEWMGEDNAHFNAKQYYVAGQVLYLYRSIFTAIFHPDNWLLMPMNGLQEVIYKVGSRYLPKDDGEIGIWMDTWFIYPYSKRFQLPAGYSSYTNKGQIAPMFVEFLDRDWFALEQAAGKPIADQQMYEQHYLLNFAGMAHFYAYHRRGYAPGNTGAAFYLSKIDKHVHRAELLITWLQRLKTQWQQSEKTKQFLSRNPEVEVLRQVGMIIATSSLLLARINDGKFTCDDPMWKAYQDVRREFSEGENGGKSALARMHDQKKAKQFESVALNSVASQFDWYVLDHYCGIQLPGEIDWSLDIGAAKGRRITLTEYLKTRFSNVFKSQMKILEEKFDGHK